VGTCAAPLPRAMRPALLERDALPPRREPLLGSAPTHDAEKAAATRAPRPLPLDTNVMQAALQGGAPQAQQARQLLGKAAATAAIADTSAAAAGAPAADATPAVANPRLRGKAAAAAGGRDGGAVAQLEGGRGGCGRSGLLGAGPPGADFSVAKPPRSHRGQRPHRQQRKCFVESTAEQQIQYSAVLCSLVERRHFRRYGL